jgi:2-methylisocitrate lyase-like PEP mutase family enzyme
MTPQAAAAERFRRLHERAEPLILPNPGDAGTARLLEQAGFDALATSSAAVAFASGVRDGHVPRETMMRHIAEITASTSLPVSADLGEGFGRDPETVAETIRLAAAAGAVGGSIEDGTGNPDHPLLPLSLATERIAAAVEAARALPFPFTLTARAENFLVGRPHLDDVLTRLAAYRQVGASVLYAPCLPDEEAVASVVQIASGRPINVLAQGRGVASNVARLASLGVKRISLGSALTRVAFAAVIGAIGELKSWRLDFLGRAVPLGQMNDMFGSSLAACEPGDG